MRECIDRSRRKFVRNGATAVILSSSCTLVGCSGSSSIDRGLSFTKLDQGIREAERLIGSESLTNGSQFSLAQTLVHCAQSIEYSIRGFPEAKSALFQNTLGSAAFSIFAMRGKMSHDLTEGIPGAPSLQNFNDSNAALARLVETVELFEQYVEPLQPHFAYGILSKEDYVLAHAYHLANHFSAYDT